MLFGFFVFAGLLFGSLKFFEAGHMDLGAIVIVVSVVVELSYKNWTLSQNIQAWMSDKGTLAEALSMVLQPISIRDAESATPLKLASGEIKIEQLKFGYASGRRVFEDLSLTLQAGEKVGLVGPSGAGKSTLMNLMMRSYDVESGAIFIDQQNIAHVTQQSLHQNIGFVPQDTALFHRSLFDNIAYGRPSATRDEVIAASRQAFAHDFIDKLPNGYDTLVGERGLKLSGGQRQRIAIARAMLKNAPILLLDEATSAPDSESEMLIRRSLETLMTGKTVLAIAHRLSTLMALDRIVVMDKGRIAEMGAHQELLKQQGLYAHLWSIQSGDYLEKDPT